MPSGACFIGKIVTKELRLMVNISSGHNKEGGNHLDQVRNRQTMEDADGGLHPAVDGQSLHERRKTIFS